MKSDELEEALKGYPEYLTKHYELRPCPFCLGRPKISWDYRIDGAGTSCNANVFCTRCGATIPRFSAQNEGKVELLQKWPMRLYKFYTNTNPVEIAVKAWNGELDI